MMYNASSITEVFVAEVLLALGIGFQESAIITYVGEVCEPSLRGKSLPFAHVFLVSNSLFVFHFAGVLLAYSSLVSIFGSFIIYTLNTLMPWRSVALVCMCLPILTVIALCFVPETPMWLLSKNRSDDAEKALQWLRGWVAKTSVAKEFEELQRYSENSQSCSNCTMQNVKCSHPPPTIYEKICELRRSDTMKPFCLLSLLIAIGAFSGPTAMAPFIVQIMKAYNSPIEPDRTATLVSFANNLGVVGFLTLIRFTGKRPLYLTMLSGIFLLATAVCAYGFIYLPSGYNSFDPTNYVSMDNKYLAYIPLICIILWNGFSNCAVVTLPWQLLSEVFPYK